jgi:hypothetical protein
MVKLLYVQNIRGPLFHGARGLRASTNDPALPARPRARPVYVGYAPSAVTSRRDWLPVHFPTVPGKIEPDQGPALCTAKENASGSREEEITDRTPDRSIQRILYRYTCLSARAATLYRDDITGALLRIHTPRSIACAGRGRGGRETAGIAPQLVGPRSTTPSRFCRRK